MSPRIRNWSGEHSWRPDAIHLPADEEQLAALVRRAAETGRRIKPVGSALSWSDAAEPVEEALRFDLMNRISSIDAEASRVRLQGGARLDDVNEALATAGLALDNFGSIVTQTVAGYLGTASHGTGSRTQLLSAQVVALRLVNGRGEILELDGSLRPDLFTAACAHLGCLGIVSEVTLRCVDAFDLEETLETVGFETVLGDLPRLLTDNDHLKLWWLPPSDNFLVYRFNRTDAPRTKPGIKGFVDRSGLSGLGFGALIGLTRVFPGITPFVTRMVERVGFRPGVRVDRSDRIIPYAGSIPKHFETEYAVPIERAGEALAATRDMVLRAEDYRVNFPFEVRFVAADDIPLSPAYGRDVCFLGAYVTGRQWARGYFADFEDLVADFDGRPHWGKTFHRTSSELRALYPRFDEFDRLRRACDPAGVFRNPFVDRVFGEEG
jgi:L-gulonolactone oxidase